MSRVVLRKSNLERRKLRVRKKIFGFSHMPRLSVFRSIKYIYAQIIDDETRKTLVTVSDLAKKAHAGKKKTEASFELGEKLAERAIAKKIDSVVFDRNGYRYHGRVKSLLDGVRKGGLRV